jgi:aspartate/methionine/tyrosine aminotransferase
MDEHKQSTYMQWAKTKSEAKYSLTTSGVIHYPLRDLGVRIEDLEISGATYYGYEPLQKSLSAKCAVDPDCVASSIGTSMANHLVMAAFLDPGEEVLIEHPTYEPLLAVARYLRCSVKRFARRFENAFQTDPEEIKKQITSRTKLVIITNLHNPTGVQVPAETLKQIGQIAKEVGAKVLVDEVYLECLFPESGTRYSAFHLGNEFIVTSSLTKAYGLSGLRCGWILAEPQFIWKCKMINDLYSATPAHTAELLSVIALAQLPKVAKRAKTLLDTNRSIVNRFLDDQSAELDTVRPQYGTTVFPRLRSGSAEAFFRILREKYETSVVPGRFFEMPQHFRLGLGSSTEVLEEGLRRIDSALKDMSNGG